MLNNVKVYTGWGIHLRGIIDPVASLPYHYGMRRTNNRRNSRRGRRKRVPASVIFCVFLLVVIIIAIFVLMHKRDRPADTPFSYGDPTEQMVEPVPAPPLSQQPAAPQPPAHQPVEQQQPVPQSVLPPSDPPVQRPAETRSRGIYFIQPGRDGAAPVPVRVTRELDVSSTPLQDSLNALMAGPTAAETARGLLHVIPSGARILDVRIEGNTAHINYSEEFQYNDFGREGLTAQLAQVVWTATEFPTVHDVQILIEGKRLEFLNEGVPIGRPLRR